MKRVALLTATAAGVAVGALLVAAVAAGVVSGGPAAAFLTLAALVLAVGVAIGWQPLLPVGLGLAVLGAVPLAAPPAHWAVLAVIGAAVVLSHEAARVSLDLRRPARLGPGVGRGLVARTGGLMAVAPVAATAAAASAGRVTATWLVPAGLVASALPLALPRLAGHGSGAGEGSDAGAGAGGGRRFGRGAGGASGAGGDPGRSHWPARHPALDRLGPGARLGLVVVVSLAVLGTAGAAATVRQHLPATAPASRPAGEDRPDPVTTTTVSPSTEPVGTEAPLPTPRGGLTGILLITLVAAVIVLLLSGLRRNRIPLLQEPIEMRIDDPGLDVVRPGAAELDDEPVALSEAAAAELAGEITVDLRSEPDPGRAVRFAYARVEQRLAARGIERRPAESEPELLARALGALGAEGSALADLTRLFERARFSDAPVPESMRTAAIEALDRLRPAPDREPAP